MENIKKQVELEKRSCNVILKSKLSFRAILVLLFVSVITFSVSAQETEDNYKAFSGHLSLRNMHMWHGYVVTPGVMTATSIEYNSKNSKLTLGLWGGASFDGSYKEYSYYGVYRFTDNFCTEVVSHNNYSSIEDPEIFSYDKMSSPNFVDVALIYFVSEKIPLKLYWGTIIGGNGQDYEEDENGKITDSYSNYVEMKYRLWKKEDFSLSAFAGGAFSFTTEKTFYSERPNFVNIGLTLNRSVEVLSKKIPIELNAIWNPESGKGVLQIDIPLF